MGLTPVEATEWRRAEPLAHHPWHAVPRYVAVSVQPRMG